MGEAKFGLDAEDDADAEDYARNGISVSRQPEKADQKAVNHSSDACERSYFAQKTKQRHDCHEDAERDSVASIGFCLSCIVQGDTSYNIYF